MGLQLSRPCGRDRHRERELHHHFPTKATMAAAVARRYEDRLLSAVARRPSESAGDAISVYRVAFREALSRPGLTSGIGTDQRCWPPVSNSAAEHRPAVA